MPLVFRRFAALALLALLAAFVPYARPALAATFSVTNTLDSGAGSLRAAIASANGAPGSLINFNIPTSDPGHNAAGYWTIKPTSPLPALSAGSTTIDGTTQPNGRATGPKIVLDGGAMTTGDSHGIQITSANNIVKGLVIDGFIGTPGIDYAGGSGVYIVGTGASGNQVLGCWIGLTADGASALKNTQYGVLLDNGAHNNTIGGLLAADRNIISGNGRTGYANVAIRQTQSINTNPIHDNVIEGNYIGTTPDGAAAIGGGNPGDGVLLGNWAQNNTVGGTTAAARNIISGHNTTVPITAIGVNVAAQSSRPGSGNIVAGNYIGLNAAGTAAIPNGWGVQISGVTNTTLGGAAAASRNIISGNLSTGVIVQFTGTTNNTIANNWIGLNAAGTAAIANGDEGILIQTSATGTTIGPGNVISANTREGVRLSTGGNTVKGNFLSTNSNGTASASNFANGQVSVRIDGGTNNLIGGTTAADRNVIALSKTLVGIQILGPSGTNATVDGNYIGINTSGGTPFSPTPPVGSSGILINSGSTNNIIGGAVAGAGNVIGGIEAGIKLQDTGTTGNTIKGNSIGVGAGGQVVGNKYGIWILNGPTGNTIGGTLAGESNLIANSTSQGISIDGSSSNNNTVAGDTVRDNAQHGIRVTSATGIKITQTETSGNVAGDGIALVGGNGGIAAPTNLQFSTPGGTPTLSGNACNNCVIEVFTSATRDDGEGPRYLATTTAAGTAFSLPIPGCDQFLTATARDPVTNNTSAFTKPMIDAGNGCVAPTPNIQFGPGVPVSSSGAPHLVAPGASVVYTHLLTNTGTLAGTFSIVRTTSQGWASQPNPPSVTLNPGESRAIQVTVTVPPGTTPGTVDTTAVTASVSGKPPVTRNDYTGVAQTFGVTIDPPNRSGTILPPGQIDYTHYITNTGNGPDTITLSQTHTNPNVTVSFPDGTSCALAAGAGCTRRVRITAAANASGADTTTVKATSSGPGAASDQSIDTTTFTSAPIPQITPNAQTKNALPPATVIFTHTVKNIGGASGQFTVTLQNAAPAGWSFTLSPPTSFSLTAGASKVVTLTVGVPATADANTNVTAQLQVTASSGANVPATDTVHVLLNPAFSFSAATQPTVNNAQPGQTVVFTHTLTNQANGADSFTIALTSTSGLSNLSVTPGNPISLAKGQSVQVIVSAKVINGTLAGPQTIGVTVQRVSSPQMPILRVDTVNVQGAAVPQLTTAPPQTPALPLPKILTFTHTLTNIGNQAGTFTLAAAAPGAPAGWSAAPSTPACLSNLQPSSTCQFTVQVTVPAGAYAGANSIVVTASTTGPPPASTSVTDIVNVPAIPGMLFAKDQTGFADPGALVTYTHTLTNSGNITDSYSITFQTDAGWSAIAVPQTVANVPRGGVRTVQVVVTAPSGVPAGSTGAVTATATSTLAPALKKSVVDRTTINAKAGATLTPLAQTLSANPTATLSDTVTFVHTLRNSGSIPISYTIQANTPIGWATVVTPTLVGPLAPGAQTTISIKVTVPAGTPFGVSAVTTVHVRQLNGPSTDLATANDTTLVGPQFGALLKPSLNSQFALPGVTVIYTHTLQNSGANADTFVLSTIAPNGWDTRVAPSSVDLARNGSTLITVTVRVPTSALSETLDIATVRAQSVTDNTAFGSAQERTTVLQVAAVSLSPPRFRAAIPGQTITFQHALVNIGNGVDTFALTATISGTGVLNWPVTLTPLNVTLLPGGVYPVVQVRVQVPLDASPTAIGHITVKAISRSKPSVSDTLDDVIGSPGQITNQPNKIYLPVIAQ